MNSNHQEGRVAADVTPSPAGACSDDALSHQERTEGAGADATCPAFGRGRRGAAATTAQPCSSSSVPGELAIRAVLSLIRGIGLTYWFVWRRHTYVPYHDDIEPL